MSPINTNPNKIKLLIVEDHDVYVVGLYSELKSIENIEIVGSCQTVNEALIFLKSSHIDLVISDMHLADGVLGTQLVEKAKLISPQTKVLLHTYDFGIDSIKKSMALGIVGYILKGDGKETLLKGIDEVNKGKKFYSSRITEILVEYNESQNSDEAISINDFSLTRRELQIIKLIARSYNNHKIVIELGIAKSTVSTHRQNIYKKLGVVSDVGITFFAIRNGLIDPDDLDLSGL